MPFTTNFPPDVEKWRPLVHRTVNEILSTSSVYSAKLIALKMTNMDIDNVILAIIQKESSGDEMASGDNHCSFGLMQLNYCAGTPQGLGYKGTPEGLYDSETNVFYGTLYFFKQLQKYGNLADAISAYNAGHATLGNVGDYVSKVFDFLGEKKTFLSSLRLS